MSCSSSQLRLAARSPILLFRLLVPLILLPLLAAGGCGGTAAPLSADPEPSAQLTGDEVQRTAGFALRVHPESFAASASGSFGFTVREGDAQVEVLIGVTDAAALTAAFIELDYDAQTLTPVAASATDALSGGGEAELLELSVLHERGTVTHSQALAQMDERPGVNGTFELARIVFERLPFGSGRVAALAPYSDGSRARTRFDNDGELTWGYYSTGDYDQNSEVNGADLAPVSKYFRAKGPWDDDAIQSVVDGDNNGEINASDLVPLVGSFRRRVTGYRIFVAPNGDDYPAENDAPSTLTPLQSIALSTGVGIPAEERVRFATVPGQLLADHTYWVRPVDGEHEGTPGEPVVYTPPNEGPTAALSADTTSGDVPLIVNFDASASSDPDGSIVKYEFDFNGNGSFEHDNGASPLVQFTYSVVGTFPAAVQVTDDRGSQATATISIEINDVGGNSPPTAALSLNPTSGAAPLTVNFDASASVDPDGSIVKYEFDFNGDGAFEHDNGANPLAQYEYTVPAAYTPAVRVTDDEGAKASTSRPLSVQGGSGGEGAAVLYAKPRYGAIPLIVTFDASASVGDIVKYEFDFDGDGVFEHDNGGNPIAQHEYTTAGIRDSAVRVTDADSDDATKIMLVMPTVNDSFPPADSIFALPSQSSGPPGHINTIELHTKRAANPFMYLGSVRLTFPENNDYKSMSFNVGEIGGATTFADGVWTMVGPTGFLLVPDFFLQPQPLGGGLLYFDVVVSPLNGTQINQATGALFNFGLVVNADISFGFVREADGLPRTFYMDEAQTQNYFWDIDTNAGMPTISVL